MQPGCRPCAAGDGDDADEEHAASPNPQNSCHGDAPVWPFPPASQRALSIPPSNDCPASGHVRKGDGTGCPKMPPPHLVQTKKRCHRQAPLKIQKAFACFGHEFGSHKPLPLPAGGPVVYTGGGLTHPSVVNKRAQPNSLVFLPDPSGMLPSQNAWF